MRVNRVRKKWSISKNTDYLRIDGFICSWWILSNWWLLIIMTAGCKTIVLFYLVIPVVHLWLIWNKFFTVVNVLAWTRQVTLQLAWPSTESGLIIICHFSFNSVLKITAEQVAYTQNYNNIIDNHFVKDRVFRFSMLNFSAWCGYTLSSITLIASIYFISEVI
jgi:hypothetical protein